MTFWVWRMIMHAPVFRNSPSFRGGNQAIFIAKTLWFSGLALRQGWLFLSPFIVFEIWKKTMRQIVARQIVAPL
jgi:hypothetical protein